MSGCDSLEHHCPSVCTHIYYIRDKITISKVRVYIMAVHMQLKTVWSTQLLTD